MKLVNISEIVDVVTDSVSEYKGERAYLSTGNLDVFNIKELEYFDFENKPSRANLNVKEGDIILARMQGTKKVKIIKKEDSDLMVSTGFLVLRSKGADINFLFHLFASNFFQIEKDKKCTGATQKAINNTSFCKIKIPLPDLATQQAIVRKLDTAQKLCDLSQTLIEKYEKLSQSLFLEMFGDPVTNPKGFGRGMIGDLCEKVNYGTSLKSSDEGKFPYLRMNNITYSGYMDFSNLKYIDLEQKDLEKYSVKNGDILFNRTNSKELVGKTGIIQNIGEKVYIFAGYLIRIKVNKKIANPFFLWAHLNSNWAKLKLRNMCKNIVGMANINAKELQKIEILLPPIELQNQFAENIAEIEKQKALAEQELAKSERLFAALLQESFS